MGNSFEDLLKEIEELNDKYSKLKRLSESKRIKKDQLESSLIRVQIKAMQTYHWVLSERLDFALKRKHQSNPNSSRTV